jgi:hypothetical protein
MAEQLPYEALDFDVEGARNKQLCAISKDNGVTIEGTGIPQLKENRFNITINGQTYTFDDSGNPLSSNARGLKLMMAKSTLDPNDTNTIGKVDTRYIREIDTTTEKVTYTQDATFDSTEITIEGLNARDQFALQALHGMFHVMEDPSAVSKNEITHYCEAAYTWASFMMKESSNARAVIKDARTTESTQSAEVGYLENNVEKLLNNIVAALDRTDEKDNNLYYERISIKGWADIMTKLTDIKDAITAQTTAITNQTTAINAVATAINNLELSPTINNNIIVPEQAEGE